MGVRKNFSRRGNVDILLVVFRLVTMQCKWTFTKLFTLSKPQRKCLMSRQQSQKCASLEAIARYITIIYSIDQLQIFKTGSSFQRSIAMVVSETANCDLISPSKTGQHHFESRAANVWDLHLVTSLKCLGTHSEIRTKP